MKKLFSVIVMFLIVTCSALVVGCDGNAEVELQMNETSLVLDVNSTYDVTVTTNSEEEILWESSDTTIVTVADGTLTTYAKEGVVSITASIGEVKDSCQVRVVSTTNKPVVTIDETQMNLFVGETDTRTATVTYNGDSVTPTSAAWKSSDQSVVTVENGVITAVAKGTAEITYEAAYYHSQIGSATVQVNVEPFKVELDQNAYTIFTDAREGATSATIIPVVTNKEGRVDNPTVTYKASVSDVLTFSGNTVSTNGYAEAEIEKTISVDVVVSVGSDTVTETIQVTVKKYTENLADMVSAVGSGNIVSVSLTEEPLSVYIDGEKDDSATYANGKLNLTLSERGVFEITLVDNVKISAFELTAADMVIGSNDDFDTFVTAGKNNTNTDAYVVFTANVDYNANILQGLFTNGFTGFIDGRGHSLSNFYSGKTGIFKSFSGTIKNLAIIGSSQEVYNGALKTDVDNTAITRYDRIQMVAETCWGTFEDCYFKYTVNCPRQDGEQASVISHNSPTIATKFSVKNCIVIMEVAWNDGILNWSWYDLGKVGLIAYGMVDDDFSGVENNYFIAYLDVPDGTDYEYTKGFKIYGAAPTASENIYSSESEMAGNVTQYGFNGSYWVYAEGAIPVLSGMVTNG